MVRRQHLNVKQRDLPPMLYASKVLAGALIVSLALMFTPSGLIQAQDDDTDTSFAIVGVNVIPMDEERILEDQTVIVSNGVIRS
ncbi:MAG: hypothetical protein V3T18_05065, partial [Pseudomonadales bacterium]